MNESRTNSVEHYLALEKSPVLVVGQARQLTARKWQASSLSYVYFNLIDQRRRGLTRKCVDSLSLTFAVPLALAALGSGADRLPPTRSI